MKERNGWYETFLFKCIFNRRFFGKLALNIFFFQFLLFIASRLFFQNVENAPTEVFKTAYKGVGLRATADFPKETFIMEYVGEVLNESKFHKRAKKYSKVSLHSFSKNFVP